jgi:hypothetical protein
VTILRPAQTYGEGRDFIHVFGRGAGVWRRLREGRPVIVHGDGSSLWIACHIDDVAQAFVGAVANERAFGRAYNVTGEAVMTWDQYTEGAAEGVGAAPPRIVLRDVSCTIGGGETLALVGENGAGKAALVKLLTRLYDPTDGEILLDGVPLRDCDLAGLRQRIAVLCQDFARFALSTQHNIGVGDAPHADDRDRMLAATGWVGGGRGACEAARRIGDAPHPQLRGGRGVVRWRVAESGDRAPRCGTPRWSSWTNRRPRSTRRRSTNCSSASGSWRPAGRCC